MSLKPLSQHESRRLGERLHSFVRSQVVPAPRPGQGEVDFTKSVLLPRFQEWTKNLKRPGLYCRGDGGPPVLPVNLRGFELYPDLEITVGTHLEVALEVKFLRGSDLSGSLSKAVGQACLYATRGANWSGALVFDLRPRESGTGMVCDDQVEISSSTFLWIFANS